ncbi:MAG: RNA polymerase-associated protein RapA [bacterium ADurb.Bin243]|nr:MAG: RNA polymerase-associated protein RapA [bacterium ADurb.Bin243]
MSLPQIGQLVQVRNMTFIVNDVAAAGSDMSPACTKVTLECVDNDRLGHIMEVIWERENDQTLHIYSDETFPDVNDPFDHPDRVDALELAILWSSPSVLGGPKLMSPFMGAIQIEDYQLEPVSRALMLPRVNLLIADDVGLGKTIEAGLIVNELLARGRIKKILIVAPASLTIQWQSEMEEKFQLEFKIIDRDYLLNLRREYGLNANPFTSFPRLIISIDYFKREQVKNLFAQSDPGNNALKSWDLLILDEAHNAAPAGRQNYVKDSDRTKLLQAITPHFEHKLFLTATPHNGFTYSFTALLELLDPLRFNRGPEVDQKQRDLVMIRRLKENIMNKNFAVRSIVAITIENNDTDAKLFDLLNSYIKARLETSNTTQISFAMTMLKKRLLSSPLAFYRSIIWHNYAIGEIDESNVADEKLLLKITQAAIETFSDDNEKDELEENAVKEVTRVMKRLNEKEKTLLSEITRISSDSYQKHDQKALKLLEYIKNKLFSGGGWNNERLIIFTEYKDSMEYLKTILDKIDDGGRILTLSGGTDNAKREEVKYEFQTDPEKSRVRILIATDAASEGLNLQHFCRYLIHYEIPWNPNKMEQRNGRIDRHGQKSPEVFINHFIYANNEDSLFLQVIIDKVRTMREDMGAISDIIEKNIEKVMLGKSRTLDFNDNRRDIIKRDIKRDIAAKYEYSGLIESFEESKKSMKINLANIKKIVDNALKISGVKGIEPVLDEGLKNMCGLIKEVPLSWQSVKKHLKDKNGNLLKLIFEPNKYLEREDTAIMHLAHPLIKFSISEFRKQLFSFNSQMSRLTYKIVDGLDKVSIKASARYLVVGALGHLLHEEVISVYGNPGETGGFKHNKSLEAELENKEFSYTEISTELAGKIRILIEKNKKNINAEIGAKISDRHEKIERTLAKKAEKDAETVEKLINERINEIKKRLDDFMNKTGEEYRQLPLFTEEEAQQFRENMKWLDYRLAELKTRLIKEPEEITRHYQIKDEKSFFLSITVYIPAKLAGEARG